MGRRISRRALVEAFILSNLAFLILDVFIAHQSNSFRHPAEWIPFYFAIGGTLALAAGMAKERTLEPVNWSRTIGIWVAVGAVAVGLGGLLYHLESNFFVSATLHNLVYTAPFAAPLSFAGLGFLLLLNRLVDPHSLEWGWWVVFFALGGFVGNFVLALCDHAINGFFYPTEWIPVFSAALAIAFLFVLLVSQEKKFIFACLWVLALQVAVGFLGFGLHTLGNYRGEAENLVDNFLYGAPVFAPLLFVDLALLAAIGLWHLYSLDERP